MSGAIQLRFYMPSWLGEEQLYFGSHNKMDPVPQSCVPYSDGIHFDHGKTYVST